MEVKLGKAFSMPEEDRETADYDIQIGFSEKEASKHLEQAKKFLEEVGEIVE